MQWALPNSHISTAFTNFANLIEDAGQQVISEQVQELTQQHIDAWNGNEMSMNRSWVEEIVRSLDESDKSIARIILLTALAPYQVCEKDIREFRLLYPDDDMLLRVTAWASFLAARRIGSWLYKA